VQTYTPEIASAREPATTFESKRKSVSKVAVEANGAAASAELTKATDASTSEKVEFVEIPVSDSNQDVAATQTVTTSKIVAAREQTTEVAQSATSAVAGTAAISTVGKSTLVEDSVEVKNDAEVVQGGQESVRPQASRNPQKCGSKQDGSTSSTEILSRSSSDDLTKIHGIGPKTAELLRVSGITTFSALNEVPTARTEEILKTAGSKFALIDSSRWQTQAGFAMNGDWDRLKQWQNDYCSFEIGR
jgi:predicted flap endonuclease-1-like 5' DNA nuclease